MIQVGLNDFIKYFIYNNKYVILIHTFENNITNVIIFKTEKKNNLYYLYFNQSSTVINLKNNINDIIDNVFSNINNIHNIYKCNLINTFTNNNTVIEYIINKCKNEYYNYNLIEKTKKVNHSKIYNLHNISYLLEQQNIPTNNWIL